MMTFLFPVLGIALKKLWTYRRYLSLLMILAVLAACAVYLQGCSAVQNQTIYNQAEGATAPVIANSNSAGISGVIEVVMKYGGWIIAGLLLTIHIITLLCLRKTQRHLKSLVAVIDRAKGKMNPEVVTELETRLSEAMKDTNLRDVIRSLRQ